MLHDPETTHEPCDHEDASDNKGHCDADEDTLTALRSPVVVEKHYC
jgi:hypothetical protein